MNHRTNFPDEIHILMQRSLSSESNRKTNKLSLYKVVNQKTLL